METNQLTIGFKSASIEALLINTALNKQLLIELRTISESEQNKIIRLLNRIQTRGGSLQHFIRYLSLTYLKQ